MVVNNNENDQNVGDPGVASPGNADSGVPSGGDTTPAGTPADPSGTPSDPKDGEIEILKKNIQGLNKALIDSRRSGRQKTSPMDNPEGNPFDTEAGQYAAALELSDARLRGNMEERLSLYPELKGDEIQRIRLNPWAFASRQSFLTGDWETALDEVEEKIATRVEELAGSPSITTGTAEPVAPVAPATVNANPAPEGEPEMAAPGTAEDQNLWTMPMAELERLKNKAVAKMSQPQQ